MYDPPHSGELILEFHFDGFSIASAAARLKMDANELAAILDGRQPVDQDIASKLEAAGCWDAPVWLRLPDQYDRGQQRLRQQRSAPAPA